MMLDIVAMGELLIDFTPIDGNGAFERNPGGAPANVLVEAKKLGGSGGFIGMVGRDAFGMFLKRVLEENGVETRGLRFSDEIPTTLAFVQLDEHGDRSFSFYRHPGADIMIRPEEVDIDLIKSAKIFHFGTLSMTDEPSASATRTAVKAAKEHGLMISFDPNYRPNLWKNEEDARNAMLFGIRFADVLKLSETELAFITGEQDIEKGAKALMKMGPRLISVTLGPDGCFCMCGSTGIHVPTYDTKVVDTTGSGDAFTGAMLFRLSRLGKDPEQISSDELTDILEFANAAGSLCAAGRGAIPSMPDSAEIERCRREIPKLILS